MGRGAEDQRALGKQPQQSQEEGQSGTPAQIPPPTPGPAAGPLGGSRDRLGPGSLVPHRFPVILYNFTPNILVLPTAEQERKSYRHSSWKFSFR